jgi:hypothetical protein
MTYFINEVRKFVDFAGSKELQDLVTLLKTPTKLKELTVELEGLEGLLKQKRDAEALIKKAPKLESELKAREDAITKLEAETLEKNNAASVALDSANVLKIKAEKDALDLVEKLKEVDVAKIKAEAATKRTTDKAVILEAETEKAKALQAELSGKIEQYNNAIAGLKAAQVA